MRRPGLSGDGLLPACLTELASFLHIRIPSNLSYDLHPETLE